MPTLTMPAFLQGAVLKAAKDGLTPQVVLETILRGLFEATIVNGRTVIRTAEAAGPPTSSCPRA